MKENKRQTEKATFPEKWEKAYGFNMHTKDAVLKASFQFFYLYFFNFEFKILMYLHIYFMFHPYAIGHNSKNSLNLFLYLIFLFQACFIHLLPGQLSQVFDVLPLEQTNI